MKYTLYDTLSREQRNSTETESLSISKRRQNVSSTCYVQSSVEGDEIILTSLYCTLSFGRSGGGCDLATVFLIHTVFFFFCVMYFKINIMM